MVIAFLGPDGSGKSTIINALKKQPAPFKEVIYFHLRPTARSKKDMKPVMDPHGQQTYSPVVSFMKLIYLCFQYNIGWLLRVIPRRRASNLIIFDRYYDDLLVDNKRYRYGGSQKLADLMGRFIPKPDIYFVLIAPAEVIINRKREIGREELERLLSGYVNLADRKEFVKIDVDRDPELVLKDIMHFIKSA